MHRQTEHLYHGKAIEQTDHPHIVRIQGVSSGEPLIFGTRIMVRSLIEQYQLGSSIEELFWDYPHLSPAQVYDALAYYHDHQAEISKSRKT